MTIQWLRELFKRKKKTEPLQPRALSRKKILEDMEKLRPSFDLTDPRWRKNPEQFWKEYENSNTDAVKVPENTTDWIKLQDGPLQAVRFQIRQWVQTVKDVQEIESIEHQEKSSFNRLIGERPTRDIVFVGGPGVGKSMVVKAVGEELKEIYQKEVIELSDVVLVENKANHFAPLVRYVPAGWGRKLDRYARIREMLKSKRKSVIVQLFIGLIIGFGISFIGFGIRSTILGLMAGLSLETALLSTALLYFGIGAGAISLSFSYIFYAYFFGKGFAQLGARDEPLNVPNILVDNGPGAEMYVEAGLTLNSSLLFGDVISDTGHLSAKTPSHLRVNAGLVHKAHQKILYLDQGELLTEEDATKLLTVIQNGTLPIQPHECFRNQYIETPQLKCLFLLCIAVNQEFYYSSSSVLNRLPAFRNRLENFGKIIFFNEEAPATPFNEMEVLQVIRDELYHYNLPPLTYEGVRELIGYLKRKASSRRYIKIMFREVVNILLTSAEFARQAGEIEISADFIKKAIEEHASSEERKALERYADRTKAFKVIATKGNRVGAINSLTVLTVAGRIVAGDVIVLEGWLKFVADPVRADFVVTGVVEKDGFDIKDAIRDVRTVIYRIYNIDIAKDCYLELKCSQARIDRPYLGLAMALLVMSLLGDPKDYQEGKRPDTIKPVPLRQDMAVTGILQIAPESGENIKVSAVSGVDEQIRAAIRYKLPYVIVPQENFDENVDKRDYPEIKVISGPTVQECFRIICGDSPKASEDDIFEQYQKLQGKKS